MAYELTWEEKGARADFNGVVSGEELKSIVSEFYGHIKFDSIHYLLINFIEIDKLEATDLNLLVIGAMDSAAAISNPRVKVAIVVDKPEIIKQLSSYEKGSEDSPWPIKYFSDINHAKQWTQT